MKLILIIVSYSYNYSLNFVFFNAPELRFTLLCLSYLFKTDIIQTTGQGHIIRIINNVVFLLNFQSQLPEINLYQPYKQDEAVKEILMKNKLTQENKA